MSILYTGLQMICEVVMHIEDACVQEDALWALS